MKLIVQSISYLFLAALLTSSPTSTAAEEETSTRPLRIGVLAALSGPAANWGTDIKNSVKFAAGELEAEHGRIELLIEDSKCDNRAAVSAVQKLTSIDKVDGLIGFTCSGSVIASAPIINSAKVIAMATTASSPKVSELGPYVFRTTPSDAIAARMLRAFIAKKHSSLVILTAISDYTEDFAAAFKDTGDKDSLEVSELSYVPDTGDIRSLLLKVKRQAPDAILLNPPSETHAIPMVRQIRTLKLDSSLYAAYAPGILAFREALGPMANGIHFVDTATLDATLNEEGLSTLKRFQKKYGEIQSTESVFASNYEGMRALVLALRSSKPLEYLNTQSFDGIFGPYRFDENGDSKGIGFVMKKVSGENIEVLPQQ